MFEEEEYTSSLISIDTEYIIVTDERDPDGAEIVPIDMSSLDIVSSGAPLVDHPSSSDEIVVPDISPPLCASMIRVYRSDKRHIISDRIDIFCSMVYDDAIDLF